MVKLCNLTITKSLPIIHKNCLQQGVLPDDRRKGKTIPVLKKAIDQCLSYPFALKSFKNLSLVVSMISSIKIIFSTTNQNSDLITLACIKLLPLHITFLVFSMLTLHWKLVAFSLICLKHLIEFAMTVSYINSRVMELTVTSLNLLNHF